MQCSSYGDMPKVRSVIEVQQFIILLFPAVFPTEILGAFVILGMLPALPTHLIIHVLVFSIINGEEYKS
jgi:hypothetical protein